MALTEIGGPERQRETTHDFQVYEKGVVEGLCWSTGFTLMGFVAGMVVGIMIAGWFL